MPVSESEKFIRQTAATVAGDLHVVAGTVGMTVGEWEHLVGVLRRDVEDAIRVGRVRVMERLERREGGA